MKNLTVTKTYNDTIYEIKFQSSYARGGWFTANIIPMVNVIKALIPATSREYNPSTHVWSIAAEYWPPLQQVLVAHDWNINWSTIEERNKNKIPNIDVPEEYAQNFHYKQEIISSNTETAALIAAKLSEYLGVVITTQEVSELKKLYRQAAMQLHPDRNPAPEAATKMSELNRLWTLYVNGGIQ